MTMHDLNGGAYLRSSVYVIVCKYASYLDLPFTHPSYMNAKKNIINIDKASDAGVVAVHHEKKMCGM